MTADQIIQFTESGKCLLPGLDRWLTIDEADKQLHDWLRELHGLPTNPTQDPPPHPRAYGYQNFLNTRSGTDAEASYSPSPSASVSVPPEVERPADIAQPATLPPGFAFTPGLRKAVSDYYQTMWRFARKAGEA